MRPSQQRTGAAWVLLGLSLAGILVGGLWVSAGIEWHAAAMFALVVTGTVAAGAVPLPSAADRE